MLGVIVRTVAEHHCRAGRVEGRTWGWGRWALGEPGGIALARGGHGGLLARGYTDRLGNLDLDVIGAADSLTGDIMLTVMLIVVAALLSVWIGGR